MTGAGGSIPERDLLRRPPRPPGVMDTLRRGGVPFFARKPLEACRALNPRSVVSDSTCLFCRIVDGAVPANVVHETERVLAFRDIDPKAPTHVLVIPKQHVASLGAAEDGDAGLLGEVMLAARDVARREGIAESGFRTVTNTGDDGGQAVHHLHVHVLGGRSMQWPPG
jgi:histidine triad (HIT) family protein